MVFTLQHRVILFIFLPGCGRVVCILSESRSLSYSNLIVFSQINKLNIHLLFGMSCMDMVKMLVT